MRRGRRVMSTALIGAGLLSACGGESGSGDDPGSIVPASAYLYAEANLDPDGQQQDAVRTVLAALPGVGDPSRRLEEQFDAYAQRRYGRHAAHFDEDIRPWLGNRVGAFALLPPHGTDLRRVRGGLIAS